MTQYWANLDVVNVTELKKNNDYYFGCNKNIVYWNNMNLGNKTTPNLNQNFITYMPDTEAFVCATTAIQFHDCYKVGDYGYAHASFAFSSPGYFANFPISVGFAGINNAGNVWVIGQKQVLTYCQTAPTFWATTLETKYPWPTEAMGVVPFIAVGGVPFYSRYKGTSVTKACTYYNKWGTRGSDGTYVASTATSSKNITATSVTSAVSAADDFATNCFGVTHDTNRVSPGVWHGKAVCPFVFPNWTEQADSSFIGGWHNRQAVAPEGTEGHGGAHTGVGFVFCGRPIAEGGSYTSWPSLSTAPFVSTTKVWVFNSSGVPQKAKQVYVYNSSGTPVKAKGLWVYNSSGTPVRVF